MSAVSYGVQMGASDQGGVTGSCELPHMGAGNLNQSCAEGSCALHCWATMEVPLS